MDCKDFKVLIEHYVDGRLNDSEKRQVEEHLETCKDCSAYFKNMQELGTMVGKIGLSGDEEYWAGQKDKIMGKIDAIDVGQKKIIDVSSGRTKGSLYKLTAIAASIALVAFISIYESRELKNISPMLAPEKSNQPIPETTQVQDMERALEGVTTVQTLQSDASVEQRPEAEVKKTEISPQKQAQAAPASPMLAPTIKADGAEPNKVQTKVLADEKPDLAAVRRVEATRMKIFGEQMAAPQGKDQT